MVFFDARAFLLISGFLAVNADSIRKAEDGEFPFQVSIKTMSKRHLCGGTIITSKWVLSTSECLDKYSAVKVSYGSADSTIPADTVDSVKVVLQNVWNLQKRNRLALIELKEEIKFSKTAAQAKLPTSKAHLVNTTKLSGWNFETSANLPPHLYVIDKYLVIPLDCRSPTSNLPITLDSDEFCGMEEEQRNSLSSPGAIVSKGGIALGILSQRPPAPSEPFIFVKLSEHNQWIKDILGSDAQYISWTDHVPKDSGHGLQAISSNFLMLLAAFLFCL